MIQRYSQKRHHSDVTGMLALTRVTQADMLYSGEQRCQKGYEVPADPMIALKLMTYTFPFTERNYGRVSIL